jgi:hypothetical protein
MWPLWLSGEHHRLICLDVSVGPQRQDPCLLPPLLFEVAVSLCYPRA